MRKESLKDSFLERKSIQQINLLSKTGFEIVGKKI
jgi:hypothetical protein